MTKEEAIRQFEKKDGSKWHENKDGRGFWIERGCLDSVDVDISGENYYIAGYDYESNGYSFRGDFLEDLIKIIHLYYLGEKNE